MPEIPQITEEHIYQLITHDHPDAVLYLEPNEDGAPSLEIWVDGCVNSHQVVLRRHDAIDVVGSADNTEDLPAVLAVAEEVMSSFQQYIDDVFAEMYPSEDL